MSGNGGHLFLLSFGFFIPLLEAKPQVDLHQLSRGIQPVEPLLSQQQHLLDYSHSILGLLIAFRRIRPQSETSKG